MSALFALRDAMALACEHSARDMVIREMAWALAGNTTLYARIPNRIHWAMAREWAQGRPTQELIDEL